MTAPNNNSYVEDIEFITFLNNLFNNEKIIKGNELKAMVKSSEALIVYKNFIYNSKTSRWVVLNGLAGREIKYNSTNINNVINSIIKDILKDYSNREEVLDELEKCKKLFEFLIHLVKTDDKETISKLISIDVT